MKKRPLISGLIAGVVGTVLVAIAAWLTIVYTGAYNVAASDQHADVVRWSFDTTMRRSVANRSGGVALPKMFTKDLISDGAKHYAKSCAHCHGTPIGKPAEWTRGMRPEPPHLAEAASRWSANEIYWIVSNGVKMTGMPAFGKHHSAQQIVAITAFVTKLPGLSANDYRALTGETRKRAPDKERDAQHQ